MEQEIGSGIHTPIPNVNDYLGDSHQNIQTEQLDITNQGNGFDNNKSNNDRIISNTRVIAEETKHIYRYPKNYCDHKNNYCDYAKKLLRPY